MSNDTIRFDIIAEGSTFTVQISAGSTPTAQVGGFPDHMSASVWVAGFLREMIKISAANAAQKAFAGAAILAAAQDAKKDKPS